MTATPTAVPAPAGAAPLGGRATTASVLAWLNVLGPAAIAASAWTIGASQHTTTGQVGMALMGGGLLLVQLTTLAAVIGAACWLQRARANADALSAAPHRLTAGWAVGGWFVPIGSLWLPYVVAIDVVRAGGTARPRTSVVAWWWATWLGGYPLLGVAFGCLIVGGADPGSTLLFSLYSLVAVLLLAVAAACFTHMAKEVAKAQDDALARWASSR